MSGCSLGNLSLSVSHKMYEKPYFDKIIRPYVPIRKHEILRGYDSSILYFMSDVIPY